MATGTKKQLTPRSLAALAVGEWANDGKPHGAGQLQARKLSTGDVAFYYRYTGPGRAQVRLPLGSALTLAQAREKAVELSRRYQAGERDLRGAIEAEKREEGRQRQAQEAAEAAEAARTAGTLGVLLLAYVASLRAAGKASARSVELSLRRNVEVPWPKLWAAPAADVSTDDLLSVVAHVADAGKLREAAKLQAYLRAAYARGVGARRNARAPKALRELQLTANPARDLEPIKGASNARQRALSVAELRAYWRRILALPTPDGALLQFHLLTGAQRVEQLGRLTTADHDADQQLVLLRDGKGRRNRPRLHAVPLIPAAQGALQTMLEPGLGPHLFTVTGGLTPAVYATVQHRVRAVVEAMLEADELERGPFTAGDLRRTVETRLAAEGVSQDVRAQLQSHGLGGVQAKHYDRHDYLPEKRAALETLHRLLTGQAAKVTPIRKKSGTRR